MINQLWKIELNNFKEVYICLLQGISESLMQIRIMTFQVEDGAFPTHIWPVNSHSHLR